MAENNVTVDPRYMSYNKDEVEALLKKVDDSKAATEEGVRNIVRGYMDDGVPDPEPEPEQNE